MKPRTLQLLALASVVMLLLGGARTGSAQSEPVLSEAQRAEAQAQFEQLLALLGLEPLDVVQIEKDRRERQRLYPIGGRIQRYVSAAGEALSEDDYEKAGQLLGRLNPDRLNPYERAQVFRLSAFVAYQAGDYKKAVDYFDKVLGEDIILLREEVELRFNVAQLSAALQDWTAVVDRIHQWFRYVPLPTPLSLYLLAIAHYQLDQPEIAVGFAEKAIDFSPEPSESWLQLLAALHVQMQDYASAAPVLEELLMRFPKREYWVQLSLIYGARDDYRHSLAVQQIAYAQGFLSEDGELLRLARSYLYANLPYQAAKVLEKGLGEGAIEADREAYELLANSWIQAREYDRSLEPLGRAAELSTDGNLYVRLGQVHMQREEWGRAASLLKKAMERGGLENEGITELLLGICYYNDNRIDEARSTFRRARKHNGTRKQADEWIAHIEKESNSG